MHLSTSMLLHNDIIVEITNNANRTSSSEMAAVLGHTALMAPLSRFHEQLVELWDTQNLSTVEVIAVSIHFR